jgi:hypothetical protein
MIASKDEETFVVLILSSFNNENVISDFALIKIIQALKDFIVECLQQTFEKEATQQSLGLALLKDDSLMKQAMSQQLQVSIPF